jgi:cell division GTPase FtsZ
LATLPLPSTHKLAISDGGAGKNPDAARKIFAERSEDVLDFMRRCFGPVYDRTIVCAGAGGGTGAGTVVGLVEKARELQIANKCSSDKVGVVLALPKVTEGKKPNANAYWVLRAIMKLVEAGTVAPLVVLDNERISALYPGLAIDPFWQKANSSVCSLFDLFNTICVQNSTYTAFDPNDFKGILDSGLIVFGATPVSRWREAGGISFALRDNLKRNILSGGVNLSTGSIGAAVVIASRAILNEVPHEHLDQAFDQLTRLLRPGSTVHRGIYSGSKETMAVYTAIGGLKNMDEKFDELQRLGDILVTEKPGAGTVLGEHRAS